RFHAVRKRGWDPGGRQASDRALHAQQPIVFAGMPVRERAVTRKRLRARDGSLVHSPQLTRAGQAEVERGTDALGGQWETVTGGVAHEEHAVLDGGSALGGGPIALET